MHAEPNDFVVFNEECDDMSICGQISGLRRD